MKIAVDLDDTLAEMQKGWLKFHNKKYGSDFLFENLKHYQELEGIESDELFNRMLEFYQTKEFEQLNTVFGAVEGIEKLSRKHEIILVSCRDASLAERTLKWVNKNFSNKFDRVEHIPNNPDRLEAKVKLCSDLEIDIFIDDTLEDANYLSENGINVLLLDKPWNREPYDSNLIRRMISWKEVYKTVKNF